MIHSKHGNIAKRVGSLLCALALILHFAFMPLRARAFAGVLPAVGAGVVVTAALMASGIYPYAEAEDFAEYVTDNLQELWNQYLNWRSENQMSPPETGGDIAKITAFLSAGTLLIADKVWRTLVDFVSWIIDEFQVTDNQNSLQLGASLPYAALVPAEVLTIRTSGVTLSIVPTYSTTLHYYAFLCQNGTILKLYTFCIGTSVTCSYYWSDKSPATMGNLSSYLSSAANGKRVYRQEYNIPSNSRYIYALDFVPYQGSLDATFDYVITNLSDFLLGDSGITADTTTVSALPALPADTPWGGLAVEGIGTAATVGAVEQVIQDGVTEREKPEVKVVDVEIQSGTDVDTETGEVTENPVVVTPESVIPAVSELTAPQAFLDTLQTTMTTKFPFCLPFDIMRLLSAFVKEPQAPLISLSFRDPFSDTEYTVSVDLSPWDDVAAIVRQLESMILLVGFWLNFDKFNMLNIILGQLG